MTVTIEDIRQAAERIDGHVVRTPLVAAPRISEIAGCALHLKLENLQATGSFKDRGAYNKLCQLSKDQAERGVIAMSAGNHAQGVAYHASNLGMPSTIVMPEFAPFSKVERTKNYGARVILGGDTLDASAITARELAEKEGLTFVHPYDDDAIIAGQGTIGLEILADDSDIDCIVVPIGGGGIISGIALAAKALRPEIEIIGVEVELFPSMHNAIKKREAVCGGATLADGIAVKVPGERTKAIIEEHVSDILLVDEGAVEQAVALLIEQQKIVSEGAGAAGLAAILASPERFKGKKVATVICGGNIDVRMLSWVLARGLVRDGRMVRLRISIVDQPGQLATLTQIIGDCGANIIEVIHQRLFNDIPAKRADIDIVVETRNLEHVDEIIEKLIAVGYPTRALASKSSENMV